MKICEICGISIPNNRKYCSECADCANKGTTEKSHENLKLTEIIRAAKFMDVDVKELF